jgi:hypothetical protein
MNAIRNGIKDKIKKEIKEELNLNEFSIKIEVVTELLDKNPHILENLTKTISKYTELFIPTIKELNIKTINTHITYIENLGSIKFTKNQTIKIILNK